MAAEEPPLTRVAETEARPRVSPWLRIPLGLGLLVMGFLIPGQPLMVLMMSASHPNHRGAGAAHMAWLLVLGALPVFFAGIAVLARPHVRRTLLVGALLLLGGGVTILCLLGLQDAAVPASTQRVGEIALGGAALGTVLLVFGR